MAQSHCMRPSTDRGDVSLHRRLRPSICRAIQACNHKPAAPSSVPRAAAAAAAAASSTSSEHACRVRSASHAGVAWYLRYSLDGSNDQEYQPIVAARAVDATTRSATHESVGDAQSAVPGSRAHTCVHLSSSRSCSAHLTWRAGTRLGARPSSAPPAGVGSRKESPRGNGPRPPRLRRWVARRRSRASSRCWPRPRSRHARSRRCCEAKGAAAPRARLIGSSECSQLCTRSCVHAPACICPWRSGSP
jgi:hypothetical protein